MVVLVVAVVMVLGAFFVAVFVVLRVKVVIVVVVVGSAALVVIVVTVLEVLADEAGAGRVVPAVDVVLGRYATNLHIWVRKRPGRYVDVPRPLFEGLYENHTGPYLSGFDG